MKKLFLLLLIISLSSAYADSIYVGLHTDHTVPGVFNEQNNVLVAQLDNGLTIGSMLNSYSKPSVIVGYVQPNKPIALGLVLATGYEPWHFHLEKYLDSTPAIPIPVASLSIDITKSVSISTNIFAGVAINTGIKLSF